jgi:hypothetical protein
VLAEQVAKRRSVHAEIVVGITSVDGDCTDNRAATLTVHCTTMTDRISVDWMLVLRVEFDALQRELGCE